MKSQPMPNLDETLRLREALESIVRRWDDSERTGSSAWLMCEDARAALGMAPPSSDGPGPADCDDILGKSHYTRR